MMIMQATTLPPLPPGIDPNRLVGEVVPLIAVIGALIAGAYVFRWFFASPVAEALSERIRAGMHRRRHWKGFGGEWMDTPGEALGEERRVAALEQQVSALQGQLSELAERVDFAERMLAERRERKLSAGP